MDNNFIVIEGEYIDIDAESKPLLINTDTYLVSINEKTGIIDNRDLPTNSGFVDVAFINYNATYGGIAVSTNEQVSLTIQSDPNNMNTDPGIGIHNFYKGKIIRVTASSTLECPNIYRFNNWSGDIKSEVSSIYITMDEDKLILATYSLVDKLCGDECHPIQTGDINADCYINFDDFLLFSAEWLSCTHPDCD